MNTVDSLKKLYKTMAGKDWPYDPNPTDAEVIDKIAADGNGGGGSKEEFDFKAFCQEWSPIMAAEGFGPEVQMAIIQAMNEFPQNISIHCSGSAGSSTFVADEDYGDYFLPILQNCVASGQRSVTLVTDMSVEGVTARTYIGPLFLDNNSLLGSSSSPTYYELKPASGQWCSRVYTQNGREFIQETIKFLVWEEEEEEEEEPGLG